MASITDVLLQTKGENGKRPQRIMVFDVAAETGGALSVLKDFYDELKRRNDLDDVYFFFVLSTIELPETRNIRVLRFPWVKRSWSHRFFFDHIIAPRLVLIKNIDVVFSLQNLTIPHTTKPQIVFIHQAIPFSKFRFSIYKNFIFWIYQNIISKMILNSIKIAKYVIVQTNFMKTACLCLSKEPNNKFIVVNPVFDFAVKKKFIYTSNHLKTFFYPAAPLEYKNHKIIISAFKKIKNAYPENCLDLKCIFTMTGKENKLASFLFRETIRHNIPIHFIGPITRLEAFELYTKSILIFPSFIETLGLPLLEAKQSNCVILASDTEFSREVLNTYPNSHYFNPYNVDELAFLIKFVSSNYLDSIK